MYPLFFSIRYVHAHPLTGVGVRFSPNGIPEATATPINTSMAPMSCTQEMVIPENSEMIMVTMGTRLKKRDVLLAPIAFIPSFQKRYPNTVVKHAIKAIPPHAPRGMADTDKVVG